MILFMTVFTNGNLLKEKYGYFGSHLFAGRCYGKRAGDASRDTSCLA